MHSACRELIGLLASTPLLIVDFFTRKNLIADLFYEKELVVDLFRRKNLIMDLFFEKELVVDIFVVSYLRERI